MDETDGPIKKVLVAIADMCDNGQCDKDESKQARTVLLHALTHMKASRELLGLGKKWSLVKDSYIELGAMQ